MFYREASVSNPSPGQPRVATLTKTNIQLTHEPMGWIQAVRTASAPLIADGSIEPSYVDAIIETAEKMGPYFDLGGNVAFLHARPEAGVNAVGLSLLRTFTPVLLLDREDHPIDVFITFAAVDNNSHIEVLRALATVLTDTQRLAEVKNAETAEAIADVFSRVS